MGPADGRGDEGVGSNWSGGGHRSMELPPYVTLMEGMDVLFFCDNYNISGAGP